MWLLHYCSPCLHSAKPKLQRNHQKRLEIFALASNVSAFYTSCLEKRFRSCWLEWKQVSSWWLTGSLRSLPDLLSILPRPQGAFPPYEVLPLQILTGAFPLFFRSHQPTCWLEWDWPCTATGQVPYPAPATQVEYNRSFPSCLQLKVQEYFLGHWGGVITREQGKKWWACVSARRQLPAWTIPSGGLCSASVLQTEQVNKIKAVPGCSCTV